MTSHGPRGWPHRRQPIHTGHIPCQAYPGSSPRWRRALALVPSTRKLYDVGQRHHHTCQIRPLPASEMQLAELVTYLADTVNTAPVTANTYLAAMVAAH